jgi:uncharacterized protein YbbC (DUF1343 family)
MNKPVQFGIDHLLEQTNQLRNLRLALVTNNAATTSKAEQSRAVLLKRGFHISKLFSPEHGLTAKGEDGVFQKNRIDPLTQLPVISLYGKSLMPSEKDLADADAVLFDIPDVGCRFYTYLWTMTYVMEACATFNKPFIVLDRPNPASGNIELAEGPMLDEENCSSFIGRWSIPVRHSCTLGELANYFASTRIKGLDLEIIKVQNWNREQTAKEAGWFFTPTSPAITDTETALLYPGMGLLEGINVNEGRGTEMSFKIFGAPWINAPQLNEAFQKLQLPGIFSQSFSYTPLTGFYKNEMCNGLKFSVTDPMTFRAVNTGLQLIYLIMRLYPDYCKERLYSTRANPSGKNHLDKLTGLYQSFEKIKSGNVPDTKLNSWKETMAPYLLY